jgi:hypothetical protein
MSGSRSPAGGDPVRKLLRMVDCSAAATRKLAESTVTALAAPIVAASAPPMTGPAMSAPEANADRKPLAAESRSGPTSAGTAPKTAASENTNAVADRRPTTYTCATVSMPRAWAMGIVATSRPSATLPPMIRNRRLPWSAIGPAMMPKRR